MKFGFCRFGVWILFAWSPVFADVKSGLCRRYVWMMPTLRVKNKRQHVFPKLSQLIKIVRAYEGIADFYESQSQEFPVRPLERHGMAPEVDSQVLHFRFKILEVLLAGIFVEGSFDELLLTDKYLIL